MEVIILERLQKVMAYAGIASRRKSEDIIKAGRVSVNGKIIKELGFKVDPKGDLIKVDGKVISREKLVYIALNKPESYVTTVNDQFNRKTVLDLINGVTERIYPVGRLDYDTSGLLLLTNDGRLTYIMTHPSHMIDKKYRVTVNGYPVQKDFAILEDGVELKDGITAKAKVFLIDRLAGKTIFDITIHEGRNRQVRRMCDAISYPVYSLERLSFGPIYLDELKSGKFRYLRKEELARLEKLKAGFSN